MTLAPADSPHAQQCSACLPGTFNNFTSQTSCQACPTSTYSNVQKSLKCQACGVGQVRIESGLVSSQFTQWFILAIRVLTFSSLAPELYVYRFFSHSYIVPPLYLPASLLTRANSTTTWLVRRRVAAVRPVLSTILRARSIARPASAPRVLPEPIRVRASRISAPASTLANCRLSHPFLPKNMNQYSGRIFAMWLFDFFTKHP